jgi:hypothetical protein
MKSLSIIGMSILACVVYGIVHDQITARLCVEYFTIFHPPIFGTDDPTLLGIGWGILATWWFGLFLGVPLAIVSRAGKLPRRTATDLLRPMAILMAFAGSAATAAGTIGFLAASKGWISVGEPWVSRISPDKHVLFLTDLWAHNASYAAGFVGGFVLMAIVWRSRVRPDVRRPREGQ